MRCVIVVCSSFLLGLGCGAGDGSGDPLSVDAIDAVAQAQGDASGTGWSGTYATRFELLSCNCPTIAVDMGGMDIDFDLCEAVDFSPDNGSAPTDVLQTEGLLVVTLEDAGQMTGPVNDDGSFEVASHINLDSLLFDNQFLGRIDGVFAKQGGAATFVATYQQRIVADYAGQDIDCRATFDLDGTRND